MKKRSILEEIAIGALSLATALVAGYFIINHKPTQYSYVEGSENQPTTYVSTVEIPKIEVEKQNCATIDFLKDTDEILLARMIFGEARNCSNTEKVAVAYTAINRVNDHKKWNGETLREVILKSWQYSCFNKDDTNRKKLMNPEQYDSQSWKLCLNVAEEVLSKKVKDPTSGATHYFNPNIVSSYPDWASKLTKVGKIQTENGLSEHEFYIEY